MIVEHLLLGSHGRIWIPSQGVPSCTGQILRFPAGYSLRQNLILSSGRRNSWVEIRSNQCRKLSIFSAVSTTDDIESDASKNYSVVKVEDDVFLWSAAWLRADVYVESQAYLRYVQSFKKKFAEQEFSALRRRIGGQLGKYLGCSCLVAVEDGWGEQRTEGGPQPSAVQVTLGTLDVSLRQLAPKESMPGVQCQQSKEEASGWRGGSEGGCRYAYIANVCVRRDARRRGVAQSLMRAAIQISEEWKVGHVYCHVDQENHGAMKLYRACGFEVALPGGYGDRLAGLGSGNSPHLLRLTIGGKPHRVELN